MTFQLPENVRYWDEDDLLDDYYLEYTDKSGNKQTLTMAQARDDGWGIELTQRYFAGDVAPAENTTDGLTRAYSATKRGSETLVFEITTPKDDGFDCKDDKTYVAGYHPAGYFNGTLNFKIKTRIDNLELQNDTDSSWEDYYSKVYVTFEQTDGKFAITRMACLQNGTQTASTTLVAAASCRNRTKTAMSITTTAISSMRRNSGRKFRQAISYMIPMTSTSPGRPWRACSCKMQCV